MLTERPLQIALEALACWQFSVAWCGSLRLRASLT